MTLVEFLTDIQGNEINGMISGLAGITDNVQKFELGKDLTKVIFDLLVQKLKHHNYKIKGMSFALLEYLLINNINWIDNPLQALPNLIDGLSSIKTEISNSALFSIKLLTDKYDINHWWTFFEKVLEKTRSRKTKFELLKILTRFPNRVPLEYIIPLIEDPDSNVRLIAFTIISDASKRKVVRTLNNIKVTYSMYQAIMQCLCEGEVMIDERKGIKFVSSKKKAKINQVGENKLSNSLDEISKTQHKKAFRSVSVSSKSSNKNSAKNSYIKSYGSQNDIHNDYSISAITGHDELKDFRISRPSRNSSVVNRYRGDNVFEDPQMQSFFENTLKEEVIQRHNELVSMRNESSISEKKRKSVDNASYIDNATHVEKLLFRKGNCKYNPEFYRRPKYVDINYKAKIGTINHKNSNKNTFELRDMTGMKWFEKFTYYDLLLIFLQNNTAACLHGEELFRSIVSGFLPVNRRLITNICGCLTQAIMFHPIVARKNIYEIIRYILYALKSEGCSQNQVETLYQVSDILIQELSIDNVVNSAIHVQADEKRPLPTVNYLFSLYDFQNDIVLGKTAFFNLISFLLPKTDPASRKVLSMACSNQPDESIKFYRQTTLEIQDKLRPYMTDPPSPGSQPLPVILTKNTKTKKVIKGLSSEELLGIIYSEQSKGQNIDIELYGEAMNLLEVDDVNVLKNLIRAYINFLSVLPEKFYTEYSKILFKVNSRQFRVPQVLDYLPMHSLKSSQIRGLCRFLWNCPASTLVGSHRFYPEFYKLFNNISGEDRMKLIEGILAIEKATCVKFTDLDGMKPSHVKIIMSIASHFETQTQNDRF